MNEDAETMSSYSEDYPLVTANPTGKQYSVQEILNMGEFGFIDVMYLIALGVIGLADSLQACYVAIILPQLTCEWNLSASEQATLTSLTFMGTGIGGIFIGPLSDRFGRKPTALATSFGLFVVLASTAATNTYPSFVALSTLAGVCVGGSMSIAYTYWAEVSNESHRALGVMVITMFWNTGLTSSNSLALLTLNNYGWKVYTVIMALPAVIPVVILLFLPESPKYLNLRNKREQVVTSLRRKVGSDKVDFSEITISRDPDTDNGTQPGLWKTLTTLCTGELKWDTLRIIAMYSCLQVVFKGMLYVFTGMLATNYCHVSSADLTPASFKNGTNVTTCENTLSDSDFVTGMLESSAFFSSTAVGIVMAKKLGEVLSLKIFAVGSLFFSFFLLICMKPPILFYVAFGGMAFCSAGLSLQMFIILPQIYPTVSRNAGFGLIDGLGKLVASVAIFLITALLNYDTRAAMVFIILVIAAIVFQVLFTGLSRRLEDDKARVEESESENTTPYQQ